MFWLVEYAIPSAVYPDKERRVVGDVFCAVIGQKTVIVCIFPATNDIT